MPGSVSGRTTNRRASRHQAGHRQQDVQSVPNPADEIAEVFLDEVPGMVEAFGNDAKRSHLLPSTTEDGFRRHSPAQFTFKHFQTRRNRYTREWGQPLKKDKFNIWPKIAI